MPNGDQHDDRPLWQQVKDLEQTNSHLRVENQELRDKVKQLEEEKAALLKTIQLIKGDENGNPGT